MFDISRLEIHREKLLSPSPLFKLWRPTDATAEQLARRLMDTPMYLSDEFRNDGYVRGLIKSWFGGGLNLIYEVGPFGGLLAFQAIIPDWKCALMAKIWEKKLWGPTLAREAKELLDFVTEVFNLKRIEIDTADEKMVRFGANFDFECEGLRAGAFRWGGQPYDLYELTRLRESGGV
jgi:RimJ/RimL family protein N-acetyltransferase